MCIYLFVLPVLARRRAGAPLEGTSLPTVACAKTWYQYACLPCGVQFVLRMSDYSMEV